MDISEIQPRLSRGHHFTHNEKLAILVEWEKCFDPGQKSVLARQLGVDTNTVHRWAREKRQGLLPPDDRRENSYMMKKRERVDYERLKRENAALKVKLEQSESAVEVLGKASELLSSLARSSQIKTPEQVPEEPGPPAVPPAFKAPKRNE